MSEIAACVLPKYEIFLVFFEKGTGLGRSLIDGGSNSEKLSGGSVPCMA